MTNLKTGLLAIALTTVAAGAMAEVLPVSTRVAKENAGLGVRVGSFLVTPKADVEETYNDNVYSTTRNEKSDFITTVRPEVTARSNWSRHALNALARAEVNKYADNSSESNNNFVAAVDGRADVMKETSIGGGLSFVRDHEDRGNPNSIGAGVEPTQVDTRTAKLGAYRGLGRFNVRVDGEAKNIDHKNGYTSTGAAVNNSLRDRNEYGTAARVGYKATDITEVFVKADMDSRVYDRKGGTTTNRSNHGKSAVIGANVEMTGKTKAEVFVGQAKRNYVDAALKDISELTYGAKLIWNATDLTSIIGNITRGIEETTIGASSGYVNTSYDLGVEHAVMRNAVLNASLGLANNDYKGTAANQRNDDVLKAEVGGKYYFNRNLAAGLGYMFTDRSSNVANGDYSRNTVMVRLTGTY